MKFKIFKYNTVNSTNEKAIELIKKKNMKMDLFMPCHKKKGKDVMEENGFQKKAIFLVQFFFNLKKNTQVWKNFL